MTPQVTTTHLTPVALQTLLHCYYDYSPLPANNAVRSAVSAFLHMGAITPRVQGQGEYGYCCTPKGRAWVEALCTTPCPAPPDVMQPCELERDDSPQVNAQKRQDRVARFNERFGLTGAALVRFGKTEMAEAIAMDENAPQALRERMTRFVTAFSLDDVQKERAIADKMADWKFESAHHVTGNENQDGSGQPAYWRAYAVRADSAIEVGTGPTPSAAMASARDKVRARVEDKQPDTQRPVMRITPLPSSP